MLPRIKRTHVGRVRFVFDRAFEWLDRAIADHDPGVSDTAVMPEFTNLRSDPRWLPFLRKIHRAPEQVAAVKFDAKLPST